MSYIYFKDLSVSYVLRTVRELRFMGQSVSYEKCSGSDNPYSICSEMTDS